MVGIGGTDTGRGIFTLRKIPPDTWITSYAPLAPVRLGTQHLLSNYVLTMVRNGTEVEIDGSLCPLGIGCIIQDGSFPMYLAPDKFAPVIKARLNCRWMMRDGVVWFKSTRVIQPREELLTQYSHDNSYWLNQMTPSQLHTTRDALLAADGNSLAAAENAIINIRWVHIFHVIIWKEDAQHEGSMNINVVCSLATLNTGRDEVALLQNSLHQINNKH